MRAVNPLSTAVVQQIPRALTTCLINLFHSIYILIGESSPNIGFSSVPIWLVFTRSNPVRRHLRLLSLYSDLLLELVEFVDQTNSPDKLEHAKETKYL